MSGVLADTRAFAGCLGVEVLVDAADPTRVSVVERWESREADDAYRAWRSREGQAGRALLGALVTKPPTLTHFHTAQTL